MPSTIKAVIFDWAGTMIDYGCMAPVEALKSAFAAEGLDISDEDARRDMGRAKHDHVRALLAYPPVTASWTELKGAAPTEDDVERIYAALVPLMAEAATRHALLIPGAAALVADLRAQGVKVGSGTGYTREMMQGILNAAAEQGYAPDVVVCAGETPSGRPAPLMTWKALIEMDAWPASACVKVDDAEVGVAEGCAAGCWSVGLAASGNGVGLSPDAWRSLSETRRRALRDAAETSLKAAGAHYVVDSVADLGPTLSEIAARISAGDRP